MDTLVSRHFLLGGFVTSKIKVHVFTKFAYIFNCVDRCFSRLEFVIEVRLHQVYFPLKAGESIFHHFDLTL